MSRLIQKRKLHLISYNLGPSFDTDKFKRIENIFFCKPRGGLWASPIRSRWGWKEWCKSEEFCVLSSQFTFWYSGNILKIDRLQDIEQIPWIWHGNTIYFPDFETMERSGIDAIWLTRRGEIETRWSNPKHLYGWDCESVLVMNPQGIQPDPISA